MLPNECSDQDDRTFYILVVGTARLQTLRGREAGRERSRDARRSMKLSNAYVELPDR